MDVSPTSPAPIDANFLPSPFTFNQLWQAPERRIKGVYLWCVECGDAYLVHYFGKAFGAKGFEGRLGGEYADWKHGRVNKGWVPVDVEAFKSFRRIPLRNHCSRHLNREFTELEPLFRIWLIPLQSDREAVHVEATIGAMLRRHPATRQFLSNRQPEKYRPAPAPEVRFGTYPPIIGITVPIPKALEVLGEGRNGERCEHCCEGSCK